MIIEKRGNDKILLWTILWWLLQLHVSAELQLWNGKVTNEIGIAGCK